MPNEGLSIQNMCKIPTHPISREKSFMSFSTMSGNNQLHPPRSLRRCRSASPAPLRPPIMNIERQKALKRSWARVPRQHFGKSVLQAFSVNVDIGRTGFGNPDSERRHAKHFTDLVQSCIDNLSDLETALKPWLDVIGRGHTGFKVTSKHWEKFGEAVLSTMTEWIGPGKQHKETIKAWMVLSSFLSDRLSAASRSAMHSPMLTPRVQMMTFTLRT